MAHLMAEHMRHPVAGLGEAAEVALAGGAVGEEADLYEIRDESAEIAHTVG